LIPIIFLGILGSSKIGFAAPDPATVWLDPAFSLKLVNEDISLNVRISNVANLYCWEFKLFYETNSLNVLEITEGPFLKSFAGTSGTRFVIREINDAYNSTHGLVCAYCSMINYPQHGYATGDGVLATVKFRCSDDGKSHLSLDYPEFTYPVMLTYMNGVTIPCTTTSGTNVLVVGPETAPLDVNIDLGPLYFPNEQVECFVMTTYHGALVTPTRLSAMVYNPDGESVPLEPELISIGFYRLTFTMPPDALSGTWAIIVEATFFTDAIQAHGTSFKTCMVSLTLNSKLVHIEDTVAWIQTSVGLIRTDISDLDLRVTEIEGDTATIQTTLGTMQGTITSINNNIATIRTDIGIIKVDISNIKANTAPKAVDWTMIGLYISLALLVSIAIVLVVLYLYLRARFRSGEVLS